MTLVEILCEQSIYCIIWTGPFKAVRGWGFVRVPLSTGPQAEVTTRFSQILFNSLEANHEGAWSRHFR